MMYEPYPENTMLIVRRYDEFNKLAAKLAVKRQRERDETNEMRRQNAEASIGQIRFMAREPVIRLGGGRVTTGGAGIRLPRNACPPCFAFYQGNF